MTPTRRLIFSIAAGAVVANLFASQPVVAEIGAALGMAPGASGSITTATMLGYAAGLVFLLPLVDRLENRRLLLTMLAASVLALIGAAWAPNPVALLVAGFLVGATSCSVQMLVVIAAALSGEAERGRIVGGVMSGLMLGILLSRPVGTLIAGAFGWRWVYGASALVVSALGLLLARGLRAHRPSRPLPYLRSLSSLWPLLSGEPVLRRRASYQALLMFSFSTFWTAVAWRLAQAPFGFGPAGVALFALAGAGGAIIAPASGRAGDRGLTDRATLQAHLAVIAGLALAALTAWPPLLAALPVWLTTLLLALAALLLDMGSVADQALGRRAVNMVRPEARGRINGLFTGCFFVGGALGAAATGPVWGAAGWLGVCALAMLPALMALALRLSEPRGAAAALAAMR